MSSNVKYEVKNDKLLIEIDVSKKARAATKASASGKTFLIGTTQGNKEIELPDGEKIWLGVSCYHKPEGRS